MFPSLLSISRIPGAVQLYVILTTFWPPCQRDLPAMGRQSRRASRPAKPTAAPDSRHTQANIVTGANATIYDPALD
jgi:hypothetical protein